METIKKSRLYNLIFEQVKDLDTTNLSDDVSEETKVETTDEQKTYFWTRLYLKNENSDLEIGDEITIKYSPSGEELKTKFIAYGKKGFEKDIDNEIISFSGEDDTKILCLMIDEKEINYGTEIPFIRTLFKNGYHYEEQIIRHSELLFINQKNDSQLDYYDIEF